MRDDQSTFADIDEDAGWLVRVESMGDVPDDLGITIEASVETPTITEDHPAVLQIRIRNLAASKQSVKGGHIGAAAIESETRNPGLLLIAPGEEHESRSGCWQPVRSVSEGDSDDQIGLIPGKPNKSEFEVWSHYANNKCFPEGAYRFKMDYEVYLESSRDLDWGFTLRVIKR